MIGCQITPSHRCHIFGEPELRTLILSENSCGAGTLIVKGVEKSFPLALLARRIKPISLLGWSQQIIHIWFDTSLRCETHLDRALGEGVLNTESFHGEMTAVWVEVIVLAAWRSSISGNSSTSVFVFLLGYQAHLRFEVLVDISFAEKRCLPLFVSKRINLGNCGDILGSSISSGHLKRYEFSLFAVESESSCQFIILRVQASTW